MAIKYNVDVIELLKMNGYSTYTIRSSRILSEGTLQALREERPISFKALDTICRVCNCKVQDIIRYEKDEPQEDD